MIATTNLWLRGVALGAVVGLPVLGVGGRIAMRAIAELTGVPPAFSPSGTLTVLLMGIASGVGGGVLYAALAWLLPSRRPMRGALFALGLVLLTLRGLSPATSLSLALFTPLALAYGVLFEQAWHRVAVRVAPRTAS